MSSYGVISGPYFPAFGLNTEIYFVSLRIKSEYLLRDIFSNISLSYISFENTQSGCGQYIQSKNTSQANVFTQTCKSVDRLKIDGCVLVFDIEFVFCAMYGNTAVLILKIR